MGKFAKLFELENGEQVLAQVVNDTDSKDGCVKVKTDFNGFTVEASIGFNDTIKAAEYFEQFNAKTALDFRNDLANMAR